MSIGNKVRIGSAALLAVVLLAGILAAFRIDAIRMGGTMQVKSRQAADLIADVLPPPEYVIEPYLEATLLLQDPQRLAQTRNRLRKLRSDYDARHQFWEASDLDQELKKGVTKDTHDPASAFWRELEDNYLPALQRNDRAAALTSYAVLSQRYSEHRANVDKLVAEAFAYQSNVEEEARALLASTIALLAGLAAMLLGIVGACMTFVSKRVVRPLEGIGGHRPTCQRRAGHGSVP